MLGFASLDMWAFAHSTKAPVPAAPGNTPTLTKQEY